MITLAALGLIVFGFCGGAMAMDLLQVARTEEGREGG
jgi:hypothetical protein